ncbi:hypothetical protein [Oceanobacillus oncorhynchi]|uniref:hypothetical protein n=1 Tax=Oceanobacillus oncorhynchi TaxID=545501 RepID=UPI0025A3A38A|nr:hypothetical protein [Oceanobacillus oncorhynchi]MDM8100968.1 hypothetical protein [Oceanobacillus oncorhynchi]
MDPLTKILFAELKKQHGQDLDLENHNYYLFYQDGLFEVSLDEDEKELKVNIVLLGDSGRVYFTDKNLNDEVAMLQGGE